MSAGKYICREVQKCMRYMKREKSPQRSVIIFMLILLNFIKSIKKFIIE